MALPLELSWTEISYKARKAFEHWTGWWWFQHRLNPEHRYHVVKLNVTPNYYEVERRMELALFELMNEYVEKQLVHLVEVWWEKTLYPSASMYERGVAAIKHMINQRCDVDTPESAEYRVTYYTNLLEVYDWYYYNKQKLVENHFSPLDGPNWEEEAEAFGAKVDGYLTQIIQMRKGMWT